MPPRMIESPQALKKLVGQELGASELVHRDAGTHRAIRRSHRRPPMDSPRSRARRTRIALWHNDSSRLSHALPGEPPDEASHPDRIRHSPGRKLRPESRAFPGSSDGRRKNPRKSSVASSKGITGVRRSRLRSNNRDRSDPKTKLRSRMHRAVLQVAPVYPEPRRASLPASNDHNPSQVRQSPPDSACRKKQGRAFSPARSSAPEVREVRQYQVIQPRAQPSPRFPNPRHPPQSAQPIPHNIPAAYAANDPPRLCR